MSGVIFEWDDDKARTNRAKHGISFETAARAFLDPFAVERLDEGHHAEVRYTILGMIKGHPLFVVYTVRADVIRLISAREASRYETIVYSENRALHARSD
jgi:uncharacterized protein